MAALSLMKRVALIEAYDLDIDDAMRRQTGKIRLPFRNMDKSHQQVCEAFNPSNPHHSCHLGSDCCYRHIKTDKLIVCKHWLRGLCKKGDDCEFLHQYSMDKMPTCYFYSNFQKCENKDCPYQHISPESRTPECPWYARGFCKHGSDCKKRHVRKVMCRDYMIGFCPEGPDCEYQHPKFELPVMDGGQSIIQCHYCHKYGHKSNVCPENPNRIPEAERPAFESRPKHNVRDPGARDAAMRYQQQQVRAGLFKPNGFAGQGKPNVGHTTHKIDVDIRDDEQRIMDGMDAASQRDYSVSVESGIPEKRMKMEAGHNFGNVKTGYVPKNQPPPQQKPVMPAPSTAAPSEAGEPIPGGVPQQQKSNPGHQRFNSGINRPGYMGVRDREQNTFNKNVPYRPGVPRNLSDIKCFKCHEFGHYANNCTNPRTVPGSY